MNVGMSIIFSYAGCMPILLYYELILAITLTIFFYVHKIKLVFNVSLILFQSSFDSIRPSATISVFLVEPAKKG